MKKQTVKMIAELGAALATSAAITKAYNDAVPVDKQDNPVYQLGAAVVTIAAVLVAINVTDDTFDNLFEAS